MQPCTARICFIIRPHGLCWCLSCPRRTVAGRGDEVAARWVAEGHRCLHNDCLVWEQMWASHRHLEVSNSLFSPSPDLASWEGREASGTAQPMRACRSREWERENQLLYFRDRVPITELHAPSMRTVNHSPFGHAVSLVKTQRSNPSLSTDTHLKAARFLLKRNLRWIRIFKDKKPVFPEITRTLKSLPPSPVSAPPPRGQVTGQESWGSSRNANCWNEGCRAAFPSRVPNAPGCGHLPGKPVVPHSPGCWTDGQAAGPMGGRSPHTAAGGAVLCP